MWFLFGILGEGGGICFRWGGLIMVSIHSVGGAIVIGGCGMFVCWWFRISFKMGCACQSDSCCAMYMVFLMM